ncbi:MAG: 3-deoxy-8-phosphooctulonate synthase [Spirochaetales bacterium]|nr:3-deoxy-8-phosphooctulonate synthase [Spirochaetales bacterium]
MNDLYLIEKRPFLHGHEIGGREPFFLIAGPCVIESQALLARVCETILPVCQELGILYIFKSSFDKANRSAADSRRGPGIEEGLRLLEWVKQTYSVPVLTDVHEMDQIDAVARVVDVLQIPAFLCRQTDLLAAAAATGKWVNIKKGQFLAPEDTAQIKEKMLSFGSNRFMLTERGVSFGYNNLIYDPRSTVIMHRLGLPVIMDGTHSTQLPGGGKTSGGNREYAPTLLRAAVANGVDGLFMEVHPDPPSAWSDASNQYYLDQAGDLLRKLYELDRLVKNQNRP